MPHYSPLLQDTGILPDGARALAEGLKVNKVLVHLNLYSMPSPVPCESRIVQVFFRVGIIAGENSFEVVPPPKVKVFGSLCFPPLFQTMISATLRGHLVVFGWTNWFQLFSHFVANIHSGVLPKCVDFPSRQWADREPWWVGAFFGEGSLPRLFFNITRAKLPSFSKRLVYEKWHRSLIFHHQSCHLPALGLPPSLKPWQWILRWNAYKWAVCPPCTLVSESWPVKHPYAGTAFLDLNDRFGWVTGAGITDHGAIALAASLHVNSQLKELDLWSMQNWFPASFVLLHGFKATKSPPNLMHQKYILPSLIFFSNSTFSL